jgi:hypothetical protein
MSAFRKKPVVIEAVLWDGRLPTVEPLLVGASTTEVSQDLGDPALIIPTLEGTMRAEVGDWIIKGVKGELYPCKPDIFAATYEPASNPAPTEIRATSEMIEAAVHTWALACHPQDSPEFCDTARSDRPHIEAALNSAFAALTAAGYVVVPLNPTDAMIKAGHNAAQNDPSWFGTDVADNAYRAMVNAALLHLRAGDKTL